MKPTYKILLIYPASKKQEIETWYQTQFPTSGPLLSKLNTDSGEWYASSFSASKQEATKWLQVFGRNLGTTIPENFVELPNEVQLQWIAQMQTIAQQTLGIWIDAIFHEKGKYCDLSRGLTTMNIQLVEDQ
jgi:hypothetical protein